MRSRRSVVRLQPVAALLAVTAIAAAACSSSGSKPASTSGPTQHQASTTSSGGATSASPTSGNVLEDPDGGVRNVTFYYQGAAPLRPGTNLSELGKPALVVTTSKGTQDPNAIKAIHGMGALAFRYVQFYWAPNDAAYEGINLSKHPEWAFCRSGNAPVVGRVTHSHGATAQWYFIDANEKAVRVAFQQILANFKKQGWDGVMFDRGGAATQYAADVDGKPVWDVASSCTSAPYQKGATFADAYVNMIGLAHQVGLKTILNGGASPFDPVTPLRPNPKDPACQQHQSDKCHYLSDAWKYADFVLNESITYPKDQYWQRTFVANKRSEQDPDHGNRTIGLITTFSLGGGQHQNKADVYYAWSRVKLFDIPLAVNTGNGGGCKSSRSGVCNRYDLYPELENVRFGTPTSHDPVSSGCVGGSSVQCVWARTYDDGVDVVNVSPNVRSGFSISLGSSGCRYVYDVFSGSPLAGNQCVTSVKVDLPAWSGRPLLLATTKWT